MTQTSAPIKHPQINRRVEVRLTDAEHAQLEAAAQRHCRSVSAQARVLIVRALDRRRRGTHQVEENE